MFMNRLLLSTKPLGNQITVTAAASGFDGKKYKIMRNDVNEIVRAHFTINEFTLQKMVKCCRLPFKTSGHQICDGKEKTETFS